MDALIVKDQIINIKYFIIFILPSFSIYVYNYYILSFNQILYMTDPFNGQLDQEIALQSERKMTSFGSTAKQDKKILYNQTQITSNSSLANGNMSIKDGSFNLSGAAHPIACIATVLFKGTALFLYFFVGMLMPNVITFILVMIMSALDFWTVKNVTGRLLVGLRWWSQYDEKGQEVWRFQSYDKQFVSNTVDQAFFWTGQIASTLIWGFFLFVKALSFNLFWGVLTGINFGLSAINLYGYYRCRGDYKNKLKSLQSSSLRHLAGKLFF